MFNKIKDYIRKKIITNNFLFLNSIFTGFVLTDTIIPLIVAINHTKLLVGNLNFTDEEKLKDFMAEQVETIKEQQQKIIILDMNDKEVITNVGTFNIDELVSFIRKYQKNEQFYLNEL